MKDVELKKLADAYAKNCENFHSEGLFAERFDAFVVGYKAAQSEWVSVEERLPDVSNSVLVAFDNGDVDHDWYDKEFKHWSRLRYDTRKITHWMPLPSPPKNN